MTADKAIEILGYMGVEGNNPDEFDACNMGILAIQALDKIRAELHATAEMHEDGSYYLRDEWIDEYFDKHKAGQGV